MNRQFIALVQPFNTFLLIKSSDIGQSSIRNKAHQSQLQLKDDVKTVLHIGSGYNKGGPTDEHIAQISPLSNFSDIKLCRV